MTWDEVVAWLDLDHPADHKEVGPFVGGSFRRTETSHKGRTCTGLHRNRDAVESRSLLVLDADHAEADFVVEAVLALGCSLATYSTWSHGIEGGRRYRLVVPLDRDVTPGEYVLLAQAVMVDLGWQQFDRGSVEPERLMYRPSVQPGVHPESTVQRAQPLDVEAWLAKAADLGLEAHADRTDRHVDDSPQRPAALGVHPYARAGIEQELDRLDALADQPWAPGDGWDRTTFEVACNLIEFANSGWTGYTLADAEADLMEHAPADAEWGSREHAAKWLSAERTVADGARRAPAALDDPARDFGRMEHKRMQSGGTFVLDAPDHVPAVWGEGQRVVWAQGEAFTLAGPPGVGKTTLAGQVVRALILGGDVLGMPVRPTDGRVLYLAMDRPQQIARSLRRTLGDLPRDVLDERLVVWVGPPLADVAAHPDTLLSLCQEAEADVLVVDSIKDAAIGLTNDDVGAGYNRARQTVLAEGIEMLELHHMTKHGGEKGSKPTKLANLYGSVWIGAGTGSVVLLWGEAGDPSYEWLHLKQPAEPVLHGQHITHDHAGGVSMVEQGEVDLYGLLRSSGADGLTVRTAARLLFGESEADDKTAASRVAQARRRLDALVRAERAVLIPGDRGTRTPAVYIDADRPEVSGGV